MVTENKRRSTTKKLKKVNNLRYAEYYDMQETFDGLYAKAAKGETFDSLMDLIFSKDNIVVRYSPLFSAALHHPVPGRDDV